MGLLPTVIAELAQDGNSILRLIHYPPLSEHDRSNRKGFGRQNRRYQFDHPSLWCNSKWPELQNKDGNWLSVETKTNQMIVDSGDMLRRLTNGIIPAITHRVVPLQPLKISPVILPFFVHLIRKLISLCLNAQANLSSPNLLHYL